MSHYSDCYYEANKNESDVIKWKGHVENPKAIYDKMRYYDFQ